MNLITWLVLGLSVGYLNHLIEEAESESNIVEKMTLAIIGALSGGFLTAFLFGYSVSGLNLPSVLVSLVASIWVLSFDRYLKQKRLFRHESR